MSRLPPGSREGIPTRDPRPREEAAYGGEDDVSGQQWMGERKRMVYRLLPKPKALAVFEGLDATLQGDLVYGLQDEEVAAVFAELDPDDRVSLLDELPTSVATRLLQGLPRAERELTAGVLGYPQGSIGRRMSPEYVTTHPYLTAGQSLERVRQGLAGAETVYTLPVLDDQRRLVGIVSLRDLMGASPHAPVAELLGAPHSAQATEDAEMAARRCAELKLLALPIVDTESRLVVPSQDVGDTRRGGSLT